MLGLCASTPAWAINTFSGFDNGPGGGVWATGDARPNADAARTDFLNAIASNPVSGMTGKIDFEAPTYTAVGLGDTASHFTGSVAIAPGVTMNVGPNARAFISNSSAPNFGSPANGDQRLWLDENGPGEPPVQLEFVFDKPITAFGGFFVGADSMTPGEGAVVRDANSKLGDDVHALTEEETPGIEFFGFVGGNTRRVLVQINPSRLGINNNEILAIDDLYYTEALTPEPVTASLAAMGIGELGLQLMRRRRA